MVSAKLGLKGVVTSFLTLKANVSRGFRFPVFPELFGDRGGVVGNQALKPQESRNWDAGFTVQIPPPLRGGGEGEGGGGALIQKADISFFYFDRRITDLIQFEQNAGFARAENIGEARIKGVEVQGGFEAFNHLGVSANYTFQDPINQADFPGRQLPGRPRHELETKVEGFIDKGRPEPGWQAEPAWRIFVGLNWIDSNFLDPLNTRVVRDRVILNAGVSVNLLQRGSSRETAYRTPATGRMAPATGQMAPATGRVKPMKDVLLAFEGKNLTNDQIVDGVGFPLPGRSFFGRVDVGF